MPMNNPPDIWILADYRGAFQSTVRNHWGLCSFDLKLLVAEFQRQGFTAQVLPYAKADLRGNSFRDRLVVFQSAEDPGSKYKDYLEDLLLAIQLQGGKLIPHFHCFRAHHNKVFMELLRDLSDDPQIQTPSAKAFGTLEDFEREPILYPRVIKRAWGAGSSGVRLARTPDEGRRIARQFSASASLSETVKEWLRRLLRRHRGYVANSLHRQKFIVQEFVPGLTGDFKVLVYWDRYYVLERKNRPGDFRASGSGRFSWPEIAPAVLLDFARRVFSHFDVPLISLDVALTEGKPILLECQFVTFGPLTMEQSRWHFQADGPGWKRVDGPSVPEASYASSVASYARARGLVSPG